MKVRHIAIAVPDALQAQKFFEEAFGLTKAGNAGNGVYMTDGTMNVALLNRKSPPYGVLHFGFMVDDLKEAQERVEKAGAIPEHAVRGATANYEAKYHYSTGITF